MPETLELELHNRQQAVAVIKSQALPFLAQVLQGGSRWVLTIKRRKRTVAQNRRYWGQGVLAQVAAQAVVNGKQYSADVWHEQFKRMFLGVEELPDGSLRAVPSKDRDTAEFSEFCAKVEAYACSELNVTFYDMEAA